jgi:hypothetical protein
MGAALGVRSMNGVLVVTVNGAEAESPVTPVTVRVYVPGVAPALTMKPVPSNWPVAVIVHDDDDTMTGEAGACEKVQGPAASAVLNPPPATVIIVPSGAAFGEITMNGAITLKVAEAESPVLPTKVTVYVPGLTRPALKLPLGAPLPGVVKLHVKAGTNGAPPMVHVVSAAEKPAPLTTTSVPTGPKLGIRVAVGWDMTVKVAEAESPAGVPVTVIV